VRYRWHAYFDRDLSVVYRETRRGEIVYVCVMPDGTGCVVPEWMFDSAACAHPELGEPQVSVDALLDLRALLMAIGSDSASAPVLTKEDRRARKTRTDADAHDHAAAVDANESRRSEVVALLARLLLQAAQSRASRESSDDAS
jgi:hypothetical protein